MHSRFKSHSLGRSSESFMVTGFYVGTHRKHDEHKTYVIQSTLFSICQRVSSYVRLSSHVVRKTILSYCVNKPQSYATSWAFCNCRGGRDGLSEPHRTCDLQTLRIFPESLIKVSRDYFNQSGFTKNIFT